MGDMFELITLNYDMYNITAKSVKKMLFKFCIGVFQKDSFNI